MSIEAIEAVEAVEESAMCESWHVFDGVR